MPEFTTNEYLIMIFIGLGIGIYILGRVLEFFIERATDRAIIKKEKEKKLWK